MIFVIHHRVSTLIFLCWSGLLGFGFCVCVCYCLFRFVLVFLEALLVFLENLVLLGQ